YRHRTPLEPLLAPRESHGEASREKNAICSQAGWAVEAPGIARSRTAPRPVGVGVARGVHAHRLLPRISDLQRGNRPARWPRPGCPADDLGYGNGAEYTLSRHAARIESPP